MSTASPVLTPAALAADLSQRDLTDPAAGAHAVQLLVDAVITTLTRAWGAQLRLVRAHPIVSVDDNYDRLQFPPGAVSRDVRYSRYVSDTCLLRTHTSALVPPELRRLARAPRPPADVLLACPGMVYRRDSIDRLHTGTPHQLDLWRIVQAPTTIDDLETMIALVIGALLPGRRHRTLATGHPYTYHGRQIEVEDDGRWVELGECGLASPTVLTGAGLQPPLWSGLAMGIGLDRALMLRKGVPDIRLLRSTDPRVMTQMTDLDPYRPVSTRPAVVRDLSLAVADDRDADAESLGDRVRTALGADADLVESVEVLATTPATDLPAAAAARLGLREGQHNVLVRLVLRPIDRALTATEANVMRDMVYMALHEGNAAEPPVLLT